MAKNVKKKNKKTQDIGIEYYVISLIAIALLIITVFRFGIAGIFFDDVLKNIFGLIPSYIFIIQLLGFFIYMLIQAKSLPFKSRYVIGSIVFLVGMMLAFASYDAPKINLTEFSYNEIIDSRLGLLQAALYLISFKLFTSIGTIILSIVISIIGVIIYFMFNVSQYLKGKHENLAQQRQQAKTKKETKTTIKQPKQIKPALPVKANKSKEIKDFFKKEETMKQEVVEEVKIEKTITNDHLDYHLPSFDLLQNPSLTTGGNVINQKYAKEKAKQLNSFFQEFNIDALIDNINIGPSITLFEAVLSSGTRVNKITNVSDDIKMALAIKEVRIQAPIPGKSAVGIEIPNAQNTLVTLKEVLNEIDYQHENKLVFGLGKDINGKAIYTSLDKMPHLLVAGSTGSGKSVCINSIIVSILMNAHYDEVKLLLIDPKMVELNIYNGIPHLMSDVISDPKQATMALKHIVMEMEERYRILAQHNMKNILVYNEYAKEKNSKLKNEEDKLPILPYIVVIIDELADLMMVSPKDVEGYIQRITQMARAAGIHLIVATQRPSTDVITGVIKANIPSRIAFAVSSSHDSRTIIDMVGAEKLLGKGDMLFYPAGVSAPTRVQGAFLSDVEVEKVVNDIKKQNIVVNKHIEKVEDLVVESADDDVDDKYAEVLAYVQTQDTISTSNLQRRFKVGYNRAANLIDALEAQGIISGPRGSKPREVLVKFDESEF